MYLKGNSMYAARFVLRTTTIAATVLAATAASTASADIGFAKAVTLCRAAVPDTTLIQIEIRERDNMLVYEGDMYTAALTANWDPRINMDTGALILVDVDSVDPSDIATLTAIFARLEEIQIDFAEAIDIATAAGSGSAAQKTQLDIEHNILSYQVEFWDLSKIYVDAATGGIVPHHGQGDDMEDTYPAASFTAAIAAATASAGDGWTAIEVEAEDESGSSSGSSGSSDTDRIEVTFTDAKGSTLLEVDVGLDGTILSVTTYSPSSSQSSKLSQIIPLLGTMTCVATCAVGGADAAFPAAGLHEVELKVEQGDLVWKVELITADLVELDMWIDASVPAQQSFAAPVNENPADFNADGAVDGSDLSELLALWGQVNPGYDLDGSGVIDGGDLAQVLGSW